jgi:hypothetical protein
MMSRLEFRVVVYAADNFNSIVACDARASTRPLPREYYLASRLMSRTRSFLFPRTRKICREYTSSLSDRARVLVALFAQKPLAEASARVNIPDNEMAPRGLFERRTLSPPPFLLPPQPVGRYAAKLACPPSRSYNLPRANPAFPPGSRPISRCDHSSAALPHHSTPARSKSIRHSGASVTFTRRRNNPLAIPRRG